MKITLELTADHIQLIKNFRFRRFNDAQYGVDSYDLLGGTYPQEDIAMIIGVYDSVLPASLEDPLGPIFAPEAQERINILHGDITEHLMDYEDILHQFADKGGLKPGKYTCNDNNRLWTYLGE